MKEERPDASLFIGLHKLAEQNGEGLVPELYELLVSRSRDNRDDDNIIRFPAQATVSATTVPSWEAGKILPFRR
ncbi:hypothetical protein FHP24_16540 [Aliirhizobium smilacinae]|uniref:Uncharacterized protein n=2 Tax=Aliirhizobium smilacinae TaxID=1395944 RepID=A0A5C4XHE6_9HYPH|nr:hypothetical protein [Rhizobium smilacinae]TNM62827.1 hypothetical protein FHP24_16540 [Rhizobium smilacinae]